MMATTDDTLVCFLCSTDTAIYFEETPTGWTGDTFAKTSFQTVKWFKSDMKFLTLKDEQLQTSDKSEDKFYFQYYKSSQNRRKGRPVMFYINQGGVNKVVCCNEEKEVKPVNMEIPKDIDVDSHKAIFYMVRKYNNVYMFESSLYESHYLGFEHHSSEGCDKLTLHHNADEVDRSIQFTLEDVTV